MKITNMEKLNALKSITTDVKNAIEKVTQKRVRVIGTRRWELEDEMVK